MATIHGAKIGDNIFHGTPPTPRQHFDNTYQHYHVGGEATSVAMHRLITFNQKQKKGTHYRDSRRPFVIWHDCPELNTENRFFLKLEPGAADVICLIHSFAFAVIGCGEGCRCRSGTVTVCLPLPRLFWAYFRTTVTSKLKCPMSILSGHLLIRLLPGPLKVN